MLLYYSDTGGVVESPGAAVESFQNNYVDAIDKHSFSCQVPFFKCKFQGKNLIVKHENEMNE